MKKSFKLTLIELLISMAIFTIMISLLIKAFQVTADTQSRLDSQFQSYDYARLAMNLVQSDLSQLRLEELKTYKLKDATTQEFAEYNKSLYLWVNTQEYNISSISTDTPLLCFFTTNHHSENQWGLKYVNAIEYGISSDKDLYRREVNIELEDISGGGRLSIFRIFGYSNDNPTNHLNTLIGGNSPYGLSESTTSTGQSNFTSSSVIPYPQMSKIKLSVDGVQTDGNTVTINDSNSNIVLKSINDLNLDFELQDVEGDQSTIRNFSRKISFKE